MNSTHVVISNEAFALCNAGRRGESCGPVSATGGCLGEWSAQPRFLSCPGHLHQGQRPAHLQHCRGQRVRRKTSATWKQSNTNGPRPGHSWRAGWWTAWWVVWPREQKRWMNIWKGLRRKSQYLTDTMIGVLLASAAWTFNHHVFFLVLHFY